MEPTAKEKDLDLGLADWAPHLLEMVIDESSMTTDGVVLLRENYRRLSPLPPGVSLALDDPSTFAAAPVCQEHGHRQGRGLRPARTAEPAKRHTRRAARRLRARSGKDRLKLVDRAWADAARSGSRRTRAPTTGVSAGRSGAAPDAGGPVPHAYETPRLLLSFDHVLSSRRRNVYHFASALASPPPSLLSDSSTGIFSTKSMNSR